MSKKPTLTVQLMHATARIAELEALFAQAEAARLALAVKHLPTISPARQAYLARAAIKSVAGPTPFQIRCMQARELAMATGRTVKV